MIADLLPLYIDNVCSPASRQAVDEHLKECAPCHKLYEDMCSSDPAVENIIEKERSEALVTQARFFKRRSALAGSIIAAIFAVPILVCLIVNLATGAGLTWFFIVLAAMFIPASLTIVPLMAVEDKLFWTIISFTASLELLLGVCCIYSGGNWFFTAATAVFFGMSLHFMPIIVASRPVAKRIGNNKSLLLVAEYTLSYVLMMICIGVQYGGEGFFRKAAALSMPPIMFLWALWALARLPKWKKIHKVAACILAGALIFFFNDTIVLMLYNGTAHLPSAGFSFSTPEKANDTLCWSVLIIGATVSALLSIIGLTAGKKEIKK